ncbi:MAG: hypothetical protein JNL38_00225 [Myxococcales bacterium]|jgi:hypothetical protein|nr:hypothetical protein [Myxococcales bacterium]
MGRILLAACALVVALFAPAAWAAPALTLGPVDVPASEEAQRPTLVEIARAEVDKTPSLPAGAPRREISLSLVSIDRSGGRVRCVVSAAVRDPKSGRLLGAASGNASVEAKAPSPRVERAVLAAAVQSAVSGAVRVR